MQNLLSLHFYLFFDIHNFQCLILVKDNRKRIIYKNYQILQYRKQSPVKSFSTFKYKIFIKIYNYFIYRKYDFENYLSCLLLPESVRSAAFVIRAFNIEISQVR